MPNRVHLRVLLVILYGALAVGAAAVLGPWLAPFLLAFALAAALEPAVALLERKAHLPRRWAALVCALLLAAVLLGGTALLARRLWLEAGVLLERLPALLGRLSGMGGTLDRLAYRLTVAAPPGAKALLTSLFTAAQAQLTSLAGDLSSWIGRWCAGLLTALPGAGLFLFTALLATYFFSAGRPEVLAFLRRQIPVRFLPRLDALWVQLKSALGGWLRAQAILMGLTFGVLSLGLLVMRVELAILIAAGVALLDALPVFGTGTVLLPWAVVSALGGNLGRAAALLCLYGAVWMLRSLLEPKLVADRVGLHPLAALIAMYGGFTLFSVAGMILAPIAAVVLKQLHASGVVRLWK